MVVVDHPVTGQTPCMMHGTLDGIIKRVLRDMLNMAGLREPQDQQEPAGTPEQTYEDLLATTVLNKVT